MPLVEAADGGGIVVKHLKDGVELGDLQQVLDALGEVEQFEGAALVSDGGETGDELTDAGAIDVVHFGEVQENLLVAAGGKFADLLAEGGGAFGRITLGEGSTAFRGSSRGRRWSLRRG